MAILSGYVRNIGGLTNAGQQQKKEQLSGDPNEVNRGGRRRGGKGCRPIIATSIRTGEEFTFRGASALADAGFSQASVWRCLTGKFKQHAGFSFRYEDGLPVQPRPKYQKRADIKSLPVIGTCRATGEKITLHGVNEIKAAGFDPAGVCKAVSGRIKSHRGFSWERKKSG